MIEVINDIKSKVSPMSPIQNLNLRAGIHTGSVIAGIIGAKVVRYDIFGQDVLIANKMESHGVEGGVCISQATYDLIQKNTFVADTFIFNHHKMVDIDVIGKQINSYQVEQIFNENMESEDGNFSDDNADQSHRSSNTTNS